MANSSADKVELRRDCEVIAVPSGMKQTLPQGTPVRIVQTRGGAFTVSNDIHAIFRIDGNDADALGLAPPATVVIETARPAHRRPYLEDVEDGLRSRTAGECCRPGAYLLLRRQQRRAGRQIDRRPHGHDLAGLRHEQRAQGRCGKQAASGSRKSPTSRWKWYSIRPGPRRGCRKPHACSLAWTSTTALLPASSRSRACSAPLHKSP